MNVETAMLEEFVNRTLWVSSFGEERSSRPCFEGVWQVCWLLWYNVQYRTQIIYWKHYKEPRN